MADYLEAVVMADYAKGWGEVANYSKSRRELADYFKMLRSGRLFWRQL